MYVQGNEVLMNEVLFGVGGVDIVATLWISGKGKIFLLLSYQNLQTGSRAHLSSDQMGSGSSFLVNKAAGT